MSATIGVELPAHPYLPGNTVCATIQIAAQRPHPIVTAFLKAGQRNVIKQDGV